MPIEMPVSLSRLLLSYGLYRLIHPVTVAVGPKMCFVGAAVSGRVPITGQVRGTTTWVVVRGLLF